MAIISYMSFCLCHFSSYKTTIAILDLGPTLLQYDFILTSYIYKDPMFKLGHILGLEMTNFKGHYSVQYNCIEYVLKKGVILQYKWNN